MQRPCRYQHETLINVCLSKMPSSSSSERNLQVTSTLQTRPESSGSESITRPHSDRAAPPTAASVQEPQQPPPPPSPIAAATAPANRFYLMKVIEDHHHHHHSHPCIHSLRDRDVDPCRSPNGNQRREGWIDLGCCRAHPCYLWVLVGIILVLIGGVVGAVIGSNMGRHTSK